MRCSSNQKSYLSLGSISVLASFEQVLRTGSGSTSQSLCARSGWSTVWNSIANVVKLCHADGAWIAHVGMADVSFVIASIREHLMAFALVRLARLRSSEPWQTFLAKAAHLIRAG